MNHLGSLRDRHGLNHVRLFQPRFAGLVLSGIKLQTVRGRPKRAIHPGDTLDLREWKGLPYRSKQRRLAKGRVTATQSIQIEGRELRVNGETLRKAARDEFARADGFADWPDMLAWFIATGEEQPHPHQKAFRAACSQPDRVRHEVAFDAGFDSWEDMARCFLRDRKAARPEPFQFTGVVIHWALI